MKLKAFRINFLKTNENNYSIYFIRRAMRESWRLIWLENIKKYVIMLKIEIDRTMRKDEVQWQTQLLQLQWKTEM